MLLNIENKSVKYVIAFDETKPVFKQLYKKITHNKIFKDNNFKFVKTMKNASLEVINGKFDVFITEDKEIVDKIIKNGFAGNYPHQTTPTNSTKYVRLSKYGEYVKARLNENVDIYIIVKNNLSSVNEAKIMKSLQLFGSEMFRKLSPDPYFEDDFDKELEQEKQEQIELNKKEKEELNKNINK